MIRIVYFTSDGSLRNIALDEIEPLIRSQEGLLWMDMVEEPIDQCRPILQNFFHFHPLAIDDALQETHVPKIDDWDSYLYLVYRAVLYHSENHIELVTPELDIFLGPNYLITYHTTAIPSTEKIWQVCQRDHRYLERGTGYLLYQILDESISNTMHVFDEIDEHIDQIEDQVFYNPQPSTLELIFAAKRAILELRRTLLPQREVFTKISRGDFHLISPQDQVYFRDIYDHLVRLQELNESMRELIGGALEIYLSVINNRMNDVMKTLTIITTLFMPLSFLTGFFGMNFFQAVSPLDAWTGKLAFMIVLMGMVCVPVGMYFWMKKRAWM